MIYPKAFRRPVLFFTVFGLITTISTLDIPRISAATNIIANPSVEVGPPTGWSKSGWGTNTPVYTYESTGQEGTKSLKVSMNAYTDGDARWSFSDVVVTPNTQYTFSVYYKSDVSLGIDIETTSSTNVHTFSYLGDIAPSPTTWKQATYNFTTATDAKSLNVYIPVDKLGFVQTDNYSLSTVGTPPTIPVPPPVVPPTTPPMVTPPVVVPPIVTPPPPVFINGFSRPLISIDFDDGWRSAYATGFPLMNEFGFKGSAMIVTDTAQNPGKYRNAYMTPAQIIDLQNQGHRIGSHSVSHADLTGLSSTQLSSEVINSKTYLENLLGRPINYFATPFCAYNSTVKSVVKQNYTIGMRNCDSKTNTKSNYDNFNVRSLPVLKSTTLQEIQAAISEAKSNNQWLVLMYHEVKNSTAAYSVTQATLRSHLQAIKDSGIAVLPSEDAIAEINGQ